MRSHEERVAAVKRRIAEVEQQKKLHRNRFVMVSSISACLVLIVSLSVAMANIIKQITVGNYSVFEMTASIFGSGEALGYLLIGLTSFVLGICVTVLCFRIQKFQKEDADLKTQRGKKDD